MCKNDFTFVNWPFAYASKDLNWFMFLKCLYKYNQQAKLSKDIEYLDRTKNMKLLLHRPANIWKFNIKVETCMMYNNTTECKQKVFNICQDKNMLC